MTPTPLPRPSEDRIGTYVDRDAGVDAATAADATPVADAATAANAAICLVHQANYLLDQQLRALEKEFVEEGGFTERLYRVRSQARKERK